MAQKGYRYTATIVTISITIIVTTSYYYCYYYNYYDLLLLLSPPDPPSTGQGFKIKRVS